MNKPTFILTISIFSVIVLSIVQVVVSTRLSTRGVDLANIQSKLEMVQKENSILSEKLLKVSSFDHIASNAAEMGFTRTYNEYTITPGMAVALKP